LICRKAIWAIRKPLLYPLSYEAVLDDRICLALTFLK
jgi:hypothetical protein